MALTLKELKKSKTLNVKSRENDSPKEISIKPWEAPTFKSEKSNGFERYDANKLSPSSAEDFFEDRRMQSENRQVIGGIGVWRVIVGV